MKSKRFAPEIYSLRHFLLISLQPLLRSIFRYSFLFIILFFFSATFQNDFLHAEDLSGAPIGPSEVLLGPSNALLESWGFNRPEFKSLVDWEYQLKIQIREQVKTSLGEIGIAAKTDIELWNQTVKNIETELWMRRCDLRNMSPERFRQTGSNTRILQAVKNESSKNLEWLIEGASKEPGAMQKAPTKQRGSIESQPGNKTRLRDRVNKRGDIPPEQQPAINQQKTGQGARPDDGPHNSNKNEITKKLDTSSKENIPDTNTASVGQKVRDEINRHGGEILFATANLEMILSCRNSGTDARDCLAQLMVSNGIATSASMAMQLLSEATMIKVAMAGTGASYIKLTYDTANLLYNLEGWASAEWERYQIETDRDKWTQINLESGSLDHQIEALRGKITATLEPLSASRESGCKNLRIQAKTIKYAAHYVVDQDEIGKLPSPDTVSRLKNLEDRVYDLLLEQHQLTKKHYEVTALSDRLKAHLKQAGDVAQNCSSEKDAQAITRNYDEAKQNLIQIQNIAQKARIIGEKLQSVEAEIQQAKATLQAAFAVRDRVSDANAKMPPYEEIETNINTVNSATQKLEDKGKRLSKEVAALRMAFPDDLDADTEYRIHELDQLIIKFQNKEGCNANIYQAEYNDYASMALESKLTAENRLRPIETLHLDLSRLKTGQAAKDVAAIRKLEQEARELIQNHQDLVQKAKACKNGAPPGENEENASSSTSDDGDGFQDEEEDTDSDDESLSDISSSGFSDESDSEGGETQCPVDDAPVETDGFSDESDDPASSINTESVTYFDRNFMPQSWKTSGNSQQVRQHIFSLGSRLGWAAALGQHGGPPAVELIIDHLKGASVHVKGAHDNSYLPMKAYKDWQQIEKKHQYWCHQLQQSPNIQGRERQLKTLADSFKSHAMDLAKKIAFQSGGNGLEPMENCDSYYLRIGYYLAYSSQTLAIAAQAESLGISLRLLRKIISDGQSAAGTAARYMRDLKKLKIATGYCIDLGEIADQVFQGTRRGKSLQALAAAAHKGWQDSLNALGGGSSGSPDMEKIGQYVFADMNKFLPKGLEKINQKTYKADTKNDSPAKTIFSYNKAFRIGSVIDHNPGVWINVNHKISKSRKESYTCESWSSDVKVLKNGQFERHGGEGSYCLRYRVNEKLKNLTFSYLFWETGDWSINLSGTDYPDLPETMFGSPVNAMNYMSRVLDHLVPRLKEAVEKYGTSEKMDSNPPLPVQNNRSQDNKSVNLLNIEAN